MESHFRTLAAFCSALYLLLTATLIACVLVKTGGHFTYALDDPYIHLALAENLAHGHYGINPTEFSSPSSSILWPFMLVPFAGTDLHVFCPLAWNLLFGVLASYIIGNTVAKWPLGGRADGLIPSRQHYVVAVLLILTANLASLTIVGMEHVLQVLFAISCAYGVIEAVHGRNLPTWCLAAAILAPTIRYENLSLTLAVCCTLAGLRGWKTAIAAFGLSLAPLAAFSLFLKSKGMPALPMSVLVKGNAFASGGPGAKIFSLLETSLRADLTSPEHYATIVLFIFFVSLTIKSRTKLHRFAYGGAASLGLLQLTIGRFGWFYRYEVYAVIFLLMIALSIITQIPRIRFAYIGVGLAFFTPSSFAATFLTPSSSHAVYLQQYQMRRFVTGFYYGNYAVNDIGLVSFQRRPGAYVLDLLGLASAEAASQTTKTAPWLQDTARRHNADLAIVYADWFDIPETWIPMAQLCIDTNEWTRRNQRCVVFYSTDTRSHQAIKSDLSRFAATLPSGLAYTQY